MEETTMLQQTGSGINLVERQKADSEQSAIKTMTLLLSHMCCEKVVIITRLELT